MTVAVDGLAQPTAVAFLPDGRLVILERGGAVRLWTPDDGLRPAPVGRFPVCTASEMGLLGVAVDPEFASNRRLFLYLTHPPGGDPARCGEGSQAGRRNRVVRTTLDGAALGPAEVILDGLRTDNGNHDGGGLVVGPDGFLYVGVGDTGRGDFGAPGASTNPYARDREAPEGKILRLTRDGAPAPGNPFAGQGGAAPLVYALGLRNPFRFTIDVTTGLLWVADVGQNTFEEIDVVRAGDDLGWPRCEGREPVSQCPGGTVPPVYVYAHGGDDASVTGGPFWDGDYVFGDFVLGRVWTASLAAARTGFAAAPEVLVRDVGGPVDFVVGPDGALWIVAFQRGRVLRVARDDGAVSTRCGAALVRLAVKGLRRAARTVRRCERGGGLDCAAAPAAAPVPSCAGQSAPATCRRPRSAPRASRAARRRRGRLCAGRRRRAREPAGARGTARRRGRCARRLARAQTSAAVAQLRGRAVPRARPAGDARLHAGAAGPLHALVRLQPGVRRRRGAGACVPPAAGARGGALRARLTGGG
ncbi:MAG: PQQ-dependent sugar dehydrogenase [bacterium]|nr:PQQ-dependent sugar dehydrogenase [bacterium]